MGFRSAFVLSAVAFLYGVLFIASIYDFPLLYGGEGSNDKIASAEAFYLSLYRGPKSVQALIHGVVGVGILALVAKIHRWSEVAKYFDGGSLVLYMAALCMYLAVTIPNMRLLSDPQNEIFVWNSALATQRSKWQEDYEAGLVSTPALEGGMHEEERISVLRIIGAVNTITLLLLLGVVLLQGTEWYLDRQERIEKTELKEKHVQQLLAQARTAKESKKDQ